jgi:hypothetical protein
MDAPLTAFTRLPAHAARMLAVETLLADPEALQDDVLESCLYLLRERLRASVTSTDDDIPPPASTPAATASSERSSPKQCA